MGQKHSSVNDTNPYDSSPHVDDRPSRNTLPSNKTLWRAYLFAPAVAPLAFVVLLLVVCAGGYLLNFEINPASVLVLPVVALTAGFVICYTVAGLIGMPIAFFLRNRNALNASTIHGAAFGWSVVFSVACMAVTAPRADFPLQHFLVGLLVLMLVVAPPVLLSATAFWLLVRRGTSSTTS